jgi:hypothetical protein
MNGKQGIMQRLSEEKNHNYKQKGIVTVDLNLFSSVSSNMIPRMV